MFSLLLLFATKVCSVKLEPSSVPLWTEEQLESFVTLWLVIFSAWIKTAMFLLYHSEGCNICEMVLHECYVHDLHTTTCSGLLVLLLLLHSKAKVLFSQLTWLVVSNHGGCRPRKVGSGTMVCMMVEVPLQLECSHRTNNQCRQWFLCRKIRSTIGSGMGRRSQLYHFPLAYQRTRHFVAVISLRGASRRVESP
jgi:hypothetical protein